MRVAGKSGSSFPQSSFSRRSDTHSATILRISSPTGKKKVVKLLLNFVLTSRASWLMLFAIRSICFNFIEAIALSRAPVSGLRDVIATHLVRNWKPCGVSGCMRIDSREHPGTEAEPPLVLVSPSVSVARGVAASSLVTRPAGV